MSLLMRTSSPVPQVTTVVHPVELQPAATFPLWQVSYCRTAAVKSAISAETRRNRQSLQSGRAQCAHDFSAGPCPPPCRGTLPARSHRRSSDGARQLPALRAMRLAQPVPRTYPRAEQQYSAAGTHYHRCQSDHGCRSTLPDRGREGGRIRPQRPVAGSVVDLSAAAIGNARRDGDQEPELPGPISVR